MNRGSLPLWIALVIAGLLGSCREVVGVEEATLDPALAEVAAAGAGGEPAVD